LEQGAVYHCVVSDVSDPAVAQRLEAALTARGPALCGLVDGRLAALVARLPRAEDLPPDGPLLVAAPPAPPSRVSGLYELGRRALRAGRAAGLTGLRALTDLALLTATEAEPQLGRLLADRLLGPLDPGDPFHRELARTALAYLDHGARIEPAAEALHVHGNTVKYRLRRLHELTGRTPPGTAADPADGAAVERTAQWWWALRAWLSAARPRDAGGGMT
ncbi:MAG: helix-turn-helix domain-containing protein, partial [Actinomadura rubrobrunea]|nr:helix-turn-helix domain-containing protein [Actinomadura rubrobrunea]